MALAAPQPADQPAESGPNPEAEADPWYGYYGYGYRPYGYGYYGYRPYGYYGKRSADEGAAESGPNANAEADPWYGYYGYGYRPYGYGYYGHRYYYGKRSADEEPESALTLMPKLTPGMVTTAMVTGLTVMATTGTDYTVMLTGDKKWTSKNNIRSFPACRLICKTPVFAKQFSF